MQTMYDVYEFQHLDGEKRTATFTKPPARDMAVECAAVCTNGSIEWVWDRARAYKECARAGGHIFSVTKRPHQTRVFQIDRR